MWQNDNIMCREKKWNALMADSLPEKSVQDSKPTETVKGKDLDINGGSN